jgi:hypothetical protein
MTDLEQREAVCRVCPERRTAGTYRWCTRDETHAEQHDCSRSRQSRFSARLTMERPTCDAWRPNGKIYLPEIPTIVYSADKPHLLARHPRVTRLLTRLGFTDWRFFIGTPGDPYWAAIRPEYIRLLRENDPPFLILEDDIAVRDFAPWIAPPPGAELIYLGGGGSWRNSRLVEAARAHLPEHHIRRVREIGLEDVAGFPEWARCFGMFGTHACLWLSKRMMLEAADAIEDDPVQVDVVLGKNQWRWQCIVRRIPMFFQDDGHNNDGTYEYATPIPPVTREQRRELAHAARGR